MDPKQPNKPEHMLPPPPARIEARSVLTPIFGARGVAVSTLHFLVHGDMPELKKLAENRGWTEKGFTALTVPWLELRWTTDGWKTTHICSSNDVPCPVVNGSFHLAGCPAGTQVEFAIHVGIACHRPGDAAFARDVADLWLNNGSKNFVQTTR